MNIYAKRGTEVVFAHPDAGYLAHQKQGKKYLIPGQTYIVERTVVSPWHTDVYLEEVPGQSFNSVMFEEVKDDVMV